MLPVMKKHQHLTTLNVKLKWLKGQFTQNIKS